MKRNVKVMVVKKKATHFHNTLKSRQSVACLKQTEEDPRTLRQTKNKIKKRKRKSNKNLFSIVNRLNMTVGHMKRATCVCVCVWGGEYVCQYVKREAEQPLTLTLTFQRLLLGLRCGDLLPQSELLALLILCYPICCTLPQQQLLVVN